jgi:hypothetical protein
MRTLLARLVRIAALAAALAPGPALADAPCLADAERLCPGIPASDGRLWGCLKRNQLQLSSQCQRNIQEVQRRAMELNADCGADVFRFCPSTPRGEGRILACLRDHVGRRELSTNCEDAVVTALEKLEEFAVGCGSDAASLCAGVEPGKGRIFLCLRAQSDKLSSRCKRAVAP